MRPNPASEFILIENDLGAAAGNTTRAQRRIAIAVTAAFWSFNFVILTARSVLDEQPDWPAFAATRAGAMLVGCGLCFLIHLAIKRMGGRPFWQRAVVLALLALVAADAFAWVSFLATTLVAPPSAMPASGAVIFTIFYWVWFFFAWAALYLALIYSYEVKAEQRRWSELRILANEAQLRARRYQVNPHFLFNILNSVSSLILDRRLADAETMVSKLASFFRASLAADPLAEVRLADELALQRLYLELEQVRFPDFEVDIDLPGELRDALVPNLILQPVVENAVKYAVAGSDGAARIAIAARADGERLRLSVADDGPRAARPAGNGVGLRNVEARLHEQFGEAARLTVERLEPAGFRVELLLPLRRPA